MKNPIKTWLEKRKQRKAQQQKLQMLHDMSFTYSTLDRMEEKGLLTYDAKKHSLFIEQVLASLFLFDADTWTAFLHNIYQWLYFRHCQEITNEYMRNTANDAVRKAVAEYKGLSRADIERIKRVRISEVTQEEIPIPTEGAFDFFIVKEVSEVTQHNGQPVPSGEVIAVGHYTFDGDAIEMATWDEIKAYINS